MKVCLFSEYDMTLKDHCDFLKINSVFMLNGIQIGVGVIGLKLNYLNIKDH